jgi:hypothetical protein
MLGWTADSGYPPNSAVILARCTRALRSVEARLDPWPASHSSHHSATAQLAGTAGRYVSRKPLDAEAAVTELREIADGRGDLLAERAGITLGFYARENRDEWQHKALQAALLIAAGADLTRLTDRVDRCGAGASGAAALRRGAQKSRCPPPSSGSTVRRLGDV